MAQTNAMPLVSMKSRCAGFSRMVVVAMFEITQLSTAWFPDNLLRRASRVYSDEEGRALRTTTAGVPEPDRPAQVDIRQPPSPPFAVPTCAGRYARRCR